MTKVTKEETHGATTEWLTERLKELANDHPSLEMTKDASRTWLKKDNRMMALYLDVYVFGVHCVYKDENGVCWHGVVSTETVTMVMSKLMLSIFSRLQEEK